MSAAGYILAINLFVAVFFAAAFAWLALYDKVRAPARWIAASFLLGMANFGVEWLVSVVADPRLVVFSAFTVSLAALTIFDVGIARKYEMAVPWKVLGALFVVALPLNLAIYDMPRGSFLRVLLYQAPYFAVQAVGAWLVFRARGRTGLDTALGVLLAVGGLHFLSKPFLAVAFGPGDRPQSYVDSIYALISQSMGSVLMVAAGLLAAVVLVRDILAEATEKSETDALTGLLNRRGFEERAGHVVRMIERSAVPAAIVICDLDHFKSINDNFGHGGGDKVIAAFADQLRAAVGEAHFAGRIGGEEFAVILPGANATAARLFAENVRAAFAARMIGGLPDDARFTASFGVAEIEPGDSVSDMLRRADGALYRAKHDGRDRVRVAPADVVQMGSSRRESRR